MKKPRNKVRPKRPCVVCRRPLPIRGTDLTCSPACSVKWKTRRKRAWYLERERLGLCISCDGQRREGRSKCGECARKFTAYITTRLAKLKRSALDAYGGPTCACCGESEIEFLTIDHVNGGGNKHRREVRYSMYEWLKKKGYPPGFRVLCMNCNWVTRYGQECPHQRRKAAAA